MVEKNKLWWFMVAMLYLVIVVLYTIDPVLAIKFAGNMAIFLLLVVLVPVRLKHWGISNPLINKLVVNRRSYGITAGFMVLIHVPLALILYGGGNPSFILRPEIISGAFAETIILIMLITSTAYLTRKLGKNWKPIHRLVWMVVGAVSVHSFTAAELHTADNTSWISLSVIAVITTVALIDLLVKLKKGQGKVAVQTLAYLILGAAIALIARSIAMN